MRLYVRVDIGVEACKPQRTGQRVRQREDPAEFRHGMQRPEIKNQGWRDAEGDGVRQGVQLRAESALTAQQPGDASVETVQHSCDQDGEDRALPLSGDAVADAGQAEA